MEKLFTMRVDKLWNITLERTETFVTSLLEQACVRKVLRAALGPRELFQA